MTTLELSLLGPPIVQLNGRLLAVRPRKALALLAYLACRGAQTRDSLATLLWPADGQQDARAALRRRLSELSQCLGPQWVESDRERVSLVSGPSVMLDVARFTALVSACRNHPHEDETVCATCLASLQAAAGLYRDDFLTGFTLSGCPEYDDWQFFLAEGLRGDLAWALERLMLCYRAGGDFAAALPTARRRLALDPLHEPAHRTLMELYARAGMTAAALRQYATCAATLDAELGVRPAAETAQLERAIKRGQFPAVAELATPPIARRAANDMTGASEAQPDEGNVSVVSVLCADLALSVEAAWDAQVARVAEEVTGLLAVAPELLAPYGAQVSRHFGNGFHALFGATQVHEDDAERAVSAALALRTAADQRGLAVAIGVNTGVVYLHRAGAEVIATGPVATLATRLQGLAGPGDILVGEATYRQSTGAFEYTPVTGAATRSHAYRLTRPRPMAHKTRGIEGLRAPLVGRERELAALTRARALAYAGAGQVALLMGEAGVGKSRLIAELRDQAPAGAPGMLWLEGRSLELSEQTAYAPWIDLLHGYFGWSWLDTAEVRAQQLAATVQEMTAQGEVDAAVTEYMGPALGNLLGLHFGTTWDTYLDMAAPQQIRYQTLEALGAFLTALARRRPLVLVLEDLHWADALSLDLVAWLLARLPQAPLLLLAAYRPYPEHRSAQLVALAADKCPDAFTELSLPQLTPRQSRALVEGLLDQAALPEAVVAPVLAQGQGNPFFLEEVVYSLIDAGALRRADGGWLLAASPTIAAVSPSVQSVVLDRVDRLTPAAKQVLQRAAVVGRRVPRWLLDRLVRDVDLDAALHDLAERSILYQERVIPEPIYAFRHVLVQEAVYQTVPPTRSATLHRQVGELLEAESGHALADRVELLAYHFGRSREVDKTVGYLLEAGDKARQVHLNSGAISYYQRALDLLASVVGTDGERAEQHAEWRLAALANLGSVFGRSGQFAEAERCFREAIAYGRGLGLAARRLARYACWLGELLNWQNREDEAIASGETVLAWLRPDEMASAEAAMLLSSLAWSYINKRQPERFCEIMEQVAPFVKSLPYAPEMRTVHAGVSQMYFRRKREAELASWSAWREEMMTRHRDRWALGEVFQSRGITRHLQGDYAAALACFAAANQAFREVGDPVRTDRYTQERGSLALMLGDLATAQSCFEQLLPAAVARGTYLWLVPLLMGLGIVHTASGDWPRATTSFTHPVPQDQHPRQANIWLARVLVAQGDRAAAVAHLARALAIMEAGDLAPRMRSCYVLFGRPVLVDALSALDVALDDSAAFAAYCRDYQAARPELARGPFKHWTLRPAVPDPAFPGADPAALPAPCDLSADGWTWYDPMEDCAYQMQGGGLILNAANGRDLWYMNRTAPRLRRPAQGDFAIQTVCRPAQADRPGLGGLLLWRGGENYLRLGIGIRGQDEVSLEGCLDNHDWVFGRGRLSAGRVWLRLERVGTRVRGLCRGDDGPWYLVGETAFPADGPVQVGLHAIGEIDRTVYHSAYPAGTALACDGLWLWP